MFLVALKWIKKSKHVEATKIFQGFLNGMQEVAWCTTKSPFRFNMSL